MRRQIRETELVRIGITCQIVIYRGFFFNLFNASLYAIQSGKSFKLSNEKREIIWSSSSVCVLRKSFVIQPDNILSIVVSISTISIIIEKCPFKRDNFPTKICFATFLNIGRGLCFTSNPCLTILRCLATAFIRSDKKEPHKISLYRIFFIKIISLLR